MTIEGKKFFQVFNEAKPFSDWLNSMKNEYKVKTERYFEKIFMIVVSEYKEKIKIDANYNVNILAIVEDACWDCQFYIPVLQRLAEHVDNIKLKLIDKEHPLVSQLKLLETTNGGLKTPYVMFYSVDGYYVDRWVERPTIVYELYSSLRRQFGFSNKEFYREYRKLFLKNQETFYRAAAEELSLKICRVNAIQGTSKRINTEFLLEKSLEI